MHNIYDCVDAFSRILDKEKIDKSSGEKEILYDRLRKS